MILTFVTGPAHSGKTRFAERLAIATGFSVTFVAAGVPHGDDPARRPTSWHFVESAREDAPALEALLSLAGERETLVIDSLPAWLAWRAGTGDGNALDEAAESLVAALAATRAHAIVVGEEAGWGLAPADPAQRLLRDAAGRLQTRLAVRAERAYLVVSGFALDLRAQGRPIDR